jgi:glutathione S-transferase
MRLFTRWQNSAGERVRIALNLKGIAYDYVAVGSLTPGAYRDLNPQGLMPALEAALAARNTEWRCCFGDAPGWADLHLVPQLAASRRLGVDLSPYRRLLAVEAHCVGLDAFRRARPEAQPDFPAGA